METHALEVAPVDRDANGPRAHVYPQPKTIQDAMVGSVTFLQSLQMFNSHARLRGVAPHATVDEG